VISVTAIDFERFHRVELPGMLAARAGGAVASGYVGTGRSLTLRVPDGTAFTYRAVMRSRVSWADTTVGRFSA